MSAAVNYTTGTASEEIILAHLLHCDSAFVPPLSSRVDIKGYAKKIHHTANNFEAWASGELIGLVAVYCNAQNRTGAFITNVSVLSGWHGMGVATQLLRNCVASARDLGFERVELEVDINNIHAHRLYEKFGFLDMNGPAHSRRMAFSLA
ncbi:MULTISPECIES: GNAT family N-acetyltransferase [Achromobacter]|uniref:GNAT family N-acetyltransferase n=1 Tax=Achromobacter denitrificans TaxID=32002 RepID=A0A6N0JTL8_ACHDE|nr:MULTISPECIES: GNAT family N-acetyltransferase [Achromobacter]QKQ50541.1 GNAT family N-acetyltransferase [Achromobacter denitrificans]